MTLYHVDPLTKLAIFAQFTGIESYLNEQIDELRVGHITVEVAGDWLLQRKRHSPHWDNNTDDDDLGEYADFEDAEQFALFNKEGKVLASVGLWQEAREPLRIFGKTLCKRGPQTVTDDYETLADTIRRIGELADQVAYAAVISHECEPYDEQNGLPVAINIYTIPPGTSLSAMLQKALSHKLNPIEPAAKPDEKPARLDPDSDHVPLILDF